MAEPATPLIATGGIYIFGIATGLDPVLLAAGFIGCWWYNSYLPELPWQQRLSSAVIAALVAAWLTPPIVLYVTSLGFWPAVVPASIIGFPCALAFGFLTHKVIGPALLRTAQKKAEELA